MRPLELLAPARDMSIGIAAIDCGADAVYIAGPSFGARHAAGNSLEDVSQLCTYAHKYGARIMLTVNTICYDSELQQAHQMMLQAQQAGVDAFIVQDTGLMTWPDISVPIHASTQCAIRDVESARWYESLGCSRLVLERELPLTTIRDISRSVRCEVECFVHGALCVCYSGQCYLSESIDGRSANRGNCMQACRSLYDLVEDLPDGSRRTIVKDKALLSLKDYRLIERLGELAEAGVDSFKIEGRLKGESYVRNVVRAYSLALDRVIAEHPEQYCRASYGRVSQGFTPSEDKTFNRGYTELYIDGQRGAWSSMDAPTSIGEFIGTVRDVHPTDRYNVLVTLQRPGNGGDTRSQPGVTKGPARDEASGRHARHDRASRVELSNGDGFAFVSARGRVVGFRGDVCEGDTIRCKSVEGLRPGVIIYRNISAAFERSLAAQPCFREIPVGIDLTIEQVKAGASPLNAIDQGTAAPLGQGKASIATTTTYRITGRATSEDGRESLASWELEAETATNPERMRSTIETQMGKRYLHYSATLNSLQIDGSLPFIPVSRLNEMRRELIQRLDGKAPTGINMYHGTIDSSVQVPNPHLTYKSNIANYRAREIALSRGATLVDDAYELSHQRGAELMRTKYCIRYELGLCPVHQQGARKVGPLHLLNNGRELDLQFDCRECEMSVIGPQK